LFYGIPQWEELSLNFSLWNHFFHKSSACDRQDYWGSMFFLRQLSWFVPFSSIYLNVKCRTPLLVLCMPFSVLLGFVAIVPLSLLLLIFCLLLVNLPKIKSLIDFFWQSRFLTHCFCLWFSCYLFHLPLFLSLRFPPSVCFYFLGFWKQLRSLLWDISPISGKFNTIHFPQSAVLAAAHSFAYSGEQCLLTVSELNVELSDTVDFSLYCWVLILLWFENKLHNLNNQKFIHKIWSSAHAADIATSALKMNAYLAFVEWSILQLSITSSWWMMQFK
jgi:hypothetical protein